MDERAEPRLVTIRFYVRPARTLVSMSVVRGVGGPARPLWWGGGRLDLGAGDLAEAPPDQLPVTLMRASLTPDRLTPMSREAHNAWQRTWRPGGP